MWELLLWCFMISAVCRLLYFLFFDKLVFKDDEEYYEKNRLENLTRVNFCPAPGRCGEHAWVIQNNTILGADDFGTPIFYCYWCKENWEIKH